MNKYICPHMRIGGYMQAWRGDGLGVSDPVGAPDAMLQGVQSYNVKELF